jgi:predicted naringenin-chalcone synthase
MYLTGIGTAAPEWRYTQSECLAALTAAPQFDQLDSRAHALLRKVLSSRNGIATRHLAIPDLREAFDLTPDALHARFAEHAPNLASQSAERALANAHLDASEVDALIISTCTGYLCPGLTSYVSEHLKLRSDAVLLDLVGQGCGAAIPNLRTAEALLTSGRAKNVLSVCTEVCSAAFYLDNDPGVLISACLFGDGSGATVLSSQPSAQGRRIQWRAAHTVLSPEDRDLLRFEQRSGMLRNILDRKVPELAGTHLNTMTMELLANSGLSRADVTAWVLHAGGREVLEAVCRTLNLPPHDVRLSADILNEFGNISSPCVLFVLEQSLAQNLPGGWWLMSSFGAGFSCHGALWKVD